MEKRGRERTAARKRVVGRVTPCLGADPLNVDFTSQPLLGLAGGVEEVVLIRAAHDENVDVAGKGARFSGVARGPGTVDVGLRDAVDIIEQLEEPEVASSYLLDEAGRGEAVGLAADGRLRSVE